MTTDAPYRRFAKDAPIAALLGQNQEWAARQAQANPTLFKHLATSQEPQILWVGCADSRVPETTILDLLPGDVFVHRNIANVVSSGDMSLLCVVQYAVEVLQVKHIIVCGITLFCVTYFRALRLWRM